jgi:hypothetical protein
VYNFPLHHIQPLFQFGDTTPGGSLGFAPSRSLALHFVQFEFHLLLSV